MKRDMDLVREILLALEARPSESNVRNVEIPGRSRDELVDHLRLMEDAGLVTGVQRTSSSALCDRLTWQGHEFLNAARNNTLWERAKAKVMAVTGTLSIEFMKETLKILYRDAIGGEE